MNSVVIVLLCALLPVLWAAPSQIKKPTPWALTKLNPHEPSKKTLPGRIVGGDVAEDGDYPYQVAVYFDTADGSFFCGGALLNENFVITAGTCVLNAKIFTLHLGCVSLAEADDHLVVDTAEHYQYHPDFNPDVFPPENDLGLIRLSAPVNFNDFIKPIALPTAEVETGENVVVTGWGATGEWGGIVFELNWVNLKTISNEDCQKAYPNDNLGDLVVCAKGLGNEGICDGDTGSPLVSKTDNVLVGVVLFSSSEGCATTHPSGFTRIFPVVDWISDVIM